MKRNTYKFQYTKPKWNKEGNEKLGDMWSWSTIYGNDRYYIPKWDVTVTGTCGKHCGGCKDHCYVKKSYRYPSVIQGHAGNTLAMREDIVMTTSELLRAIRAARKKPEIIRLNQSGEIETVETLQMFESLAAFNPSIKFYLYTKNYEAVESELNAGMIPDNLIINISIWHEYGVKEYLRMKKYENVKAFVYVDPKKEGGWNVSEYEKHGINIQTFCTAYDENGKLNKDMPCQKCGKCFRKNDRLKVVGCNDH